MASPTEPSDPPVALTVAGSDSGGGAGVQADLKTMEARGAFGTSAVTAVTAQNTRGVEVAETLDPSLVAAQFDAVVSDFDVRAVKTGMLGTADVVRTVAERVGDAPLVVDPVMVAQSGDRLLARDAERALAEELLPRADLATPNVPEAEALSGVEIRDEASMRRAADRIRETGPESVLVTGGHLDGDRVVDVLVGPEERTFRGTRIDAPNSHGSGCTLSAAVAADLARGAALPEAIAAAETFVARALRYGHSIGGGNGPVDHLAGLRNRAAAPNALAAVREVVRTFERADVSRLVPEVGMNVAVATPWAVAPEEVAAVAGRLTRVPGGVRATAGVELGASDHIARLLLGVRAVDGRIDAACNVRCDDDVAAAVRAEWETVTVDRADEPADAEGTMDWVAARAMDGRGRAPDAILDGGAVGKEPMVRVLAPSSAALREKVLRLSRRVA